MLGFAFAKVLQLVGYDGEVSQSKPTVVSGPSAPKVGNQDRKPPTVGGYRDHDLK